jgi:radical SAM superfamily enzyme YgiQ (UPF0313 family)
VERVLLYNPVSESYTMPLGLMAVGSSLPRADYQVEIHDGRLDREAFLREVARGDVLAVGLSVLTGKPIEDALATSRQVKEIRPELPIVWGGWHPSILTAQCLLLPSVDYVVFGQGDRSFLELLERLRRGETVDTVSGVAYKVDGQPVINPPRPFQDINQFPPLRYDLIDVPAYFALKGKRQIDYYSSQGCPYTCTFCADPFVYHRHWAGLSAERLSGELLGLERRYGFEDVFFNDDLFFVNQKRLEAATDHLIAAGSPFRWVAAGRADLLNRYPDSLMEKIRSSGCRRISIGAESGSQAMLDEIKKKQTVEDIYRAARRCHDYGIQLAFSFMTGFPQEHPEVLRDTLALIKRIKKVNGHFETPLFFYYAYPGTELTDKLTRMGIDLPREIEGWIDFDLYRANVPWLGKNYKDRVQRINFYLRWAFRPPSPRWNPLGFLLAGLSRLRVELDFYELPLEMRAVDLWKRLRGGRPASTVRAQIAFKLKNVCG